MTLKTLLPLLVAAPVSAAILHVDADVTGGSGDGSSWANAYQLLQDAIAVATTGDEIWVAAGIYYPDEGTGQVDNSASSRFAPRRSIRLYGGFAGTETLRNERDAASHPTILSGDLAQDDLDPDGDGVTERPSDIQGTNCGRLVDVSIPGSFVIDGFTMTGATNSGLYFYNRVSDGIVANCRFQGNRAQIGGGLNVGGRNVVVANCSFIANSATTDGGGVVSQVGGNQLSNCLFVANEAGRYGGGARLASGDALSSCTLVGNSASFAGGAAHFGASGATVANSILWGNFAGSDTASIAIGALSPSYRPLVRSCLVEGSGGSTAWTLPYAQDGGGNLDADPLLIDPPGIGQLPSFDEALRPGSGSPAIDSGNETLRLADIADIDADGNTFELHPLDLVGAPRVEGIELDMGAYESAPGPAVVAPPSPIEVDPNTTGIPTVDFSAVFDSSAITFDVVAISNGNLADIVLDPSSGILSITLQPNAIGASRITIRARDASGNPSYVPLDLLVFPEVLYVDADATGADSGLSWGDAFPALQDALAIGGSGYEIWLAEGVYRPDPGGDASARFVLPPGVSLRGGFAGTETSADERDPEIRSILSGDIDLNDLDADTNSIAEASGDIVGTNSSRILEIRNAPPGSRIDQLVITAASGTTGLTLSASELALERCEFSGCAGQSGGAVLIDGAIGHFFDCRFTGNSASLRGGAIFADNASVVTLEDCVLHDNDSKDGGAIRSLDSTLGMHRCSLVGNEAPGSLATGGALSARYGQVVLRHCDFEDNRATGNSAKGGGVFSNANTLDALDCRFSGNAGNDGGGIYLSSATSTLVNCRLSANDASNGGGATVYASDLTATGCEFSGNLASLFHGGAIYNYSSSPLFHSCTFEGNRASSNGGGIYNFTYLTSNPAAPAISNSILWNNQAYGATDTVFASVGNNSTDNHTGFDHCLVAHSGGSAAWDATFGTDLGGNLDVDPDFVFPVDPGEAPIATADLRRLPASPATDAGDSATLPADVLDADEDTDVAEPLPYDLGGRARLAGTALDLGAHESEPGPQLVSPLPRLRFEPLTGSHPQAVDLSNHFDPSAVAFSIDSMIPTGIIDTAVDPATGLLDITVLPNVFGPVAVVVAAADGEGDTSIATVFIDVFPSVLHVNAAATGLGTGLSWADAFPDLQSALAVKPMEGIPYEIWVAQGLYRPDAGPGQVADDPASTFEVGDDRHLFGGFVGNESTREERDPSQHPTILSGDLAGDDIDTDADGVPDSPADLVGTNANHVILRSDSPGSASLDGFTITAATASGASIGNAAIDFAHCRFEASRALYGGALYLISATVTLDACQFRRNQADSAGGTISYGGAILAEHGTLVATGCLFESNSCLYPSSSCKGGAIYAFDNLVQLSDCEFRQNFSQGQGGAVFTIEGELLAERCHWIGNRTGDGSFTEGGALRSYKSSPVVLRQCDFDGNSSGSFGGALSVASTVQLDLAACRFRGNTAGNDGGAIHSGISGTERYANCLFSGNFASENGGAIEGLGEDASVSQCTFSGNRALRRGGAIYHPFASSGPAPQVIQSIFWNNHANGGTGTATATIATQASAAVTTSFTRCLVMNSGGSAAWDDALGVDGGGNLDVDPRFLFAPPPLQAPTAGGDYRLAAGSPAIDAGLEANLPPDSTDLDADEDLLENLPLDLAGEARLAGGAPDLGAYEMRPGPGIASPLPRVDLDPDSGDVPGLFSLADIFDGSATGFQLVALYQPEGITVTVDPVTGSVDVSVPTGTVRHFFAVFEASDGSGGSSLYPVAIDVFPDVIFVDAGASGSGDGLSWADAIPHLQTALALGGEGYAIWVAEGVYLPDLGAGQSDDDPLSTFVLPPGVELYGGFVGGEASLAERDPELHPSILSGDLGLDDLDADGNGIAESVADLQGTNALSVVTASDATAGSLLDGFWITAGNGGTYVDFLGNGGGLFANGGTPMVRHCRFSGNLAYRGGAVGLVSAGPVTIEDCRFSANQGDSFGGAIHADTSEVAIDRSSFERNRSDWGGALNGSAAAVEVSRSTFHANSADRGGAIYLSTGSAMITNSILHGNVASIGGAIENSAGTFDARHCTFTENTARDFSGAVANPNSGTSDAAYTHCILWNNRVGHRSDRPGASSGTYAGLGSDAVFSSCLIANSGGSAAWDPAIGVDGGGNLDADPGFLATGTPEVPLADPAAFQLKTGSPAIDAAVPSAVATDIDGTPRPQGPSADLGAFEAPVPGPAVVGEPVPLRLAPNSGSHPAITDASAWFGAGAVSYEVVARIPDDIVIPTLDPSTGALDLSVMPDRFGRAQIVVAASDGTGGRSLVTLVADVVPDVVFVNRNATGSGTGLGWDDAFPTVQHALTNLVDGFEIWVAEGTYHPYDGPGLLDTGRDACFRLRDQVGLYGGFAGTESDRSQRSPRLHPTLLKGYEGGVETPATFQVVTAIGVDSSAVLDGFTVTRGVGSNSGGGYLARDGGGIFIDDASPLIADCIFLDNYSPWTSGGAAAIRNGSAPVFQRCQFIGCTSFNSMGGAVGIEGPASAEFVSCAFQGNQAYRGGALALLGSSTASAVNCTFSGNRSRAEGGAIRNESNLELTNSIVWNNLSDSATSPTTTAPGASVSNTAGASTLASHCLVANSGGSAAWNAAIGMDAGGNLDGDPLFLVPADPVSAPNTLGDLRLTRGTPALDTGDNSAVIGDLDLLAAPRITNTTVDLGAYEGQNDQLDTDGDGLSDAFELASTDPPSRTALQPDDDTDLDGLTNDAEFSFGCDPRAPDADCGPALVVVESQGESYLAIRYPSDRWARTFLETEVLRSVDLGAGDDWSAGETTRILTSPLSADVDEITERSNDPMGSRASEFLRLDVHPQP